MHARNQHSRDYPPKEGTKFMLQWCSGRLHAFTAYTVANASTNVSPHRSHFFSLSYPQRCRFIVPLAGMLLFVTL